MLLLRVRRKSRLNKAFLFLFFLSVLCMSAGVMWVLGEDGSEAPKLESSCLVSASVTDETPFDKKSKQLSN